MGNSGHNIALKGHSDLCPAFFCQLKVIAIEIFSLFLLFFFWRLFLMSNKDTIFYVWVERSNILIPFVQQRRQNSFFFCLDWKILWIVVESCSGIENMTWSYIQDNYLFQQKLAFILQWCGPGFVTV